MASGGDPINGLREALKVSPENVPLRMHLAQSLAGLGRFDEAEAELRQTLSMDPGHSDAKLALADVYRQLGKPTQAMVILEDLCSQKNAPGSAFVQHARLLLAEGKVQESVWEYKRGIEVDPSCADSELGDRLGVGQDYQDSDVYEGRVRESVDESDDGFQTEIERPTLKFEDVGGMEAVKEEIRLKILYPLQHPEMYEAYGKKVGGGILMYGPPGCGKTYLARATAGEIGAGFLSVGISDVLDMWTGQSERNLAQIFEQARFNKPCVLFFDEVDALGGRRSDMSSGAGRHVINQFLSEMDGVQIK